MSVFTCALENVLLSNDICSCVIRICCDYSYVASYLFLFKLARNIKQNVSNQYHCSCSCCRWKSQVLTPLRICSIVW